MRTLNRKTEIGQASDIEERIALDANQPDPEPEPEPKPPEPNRKTKLKSPLGVAGAIASDMPENSRLTPVRFAYQQGGKDYWLFRCSCGKKTAVELHRALVGAIRSCGCLRKEPWRANDRSKLSKDCR